MKKILLIISTLLLCIIISEAKTTRVLAIGNSFSQDAIEQHLYELALAQGDTLIIGNAYIPGCSIDTHVDNLENDNAAYSYRKVSGGVKNTTDHMALKDIITDENWDIISLQQASHFSGRKATYARLPELKRHVVELMTVKDAQIVWHMTWSYAKDSDHSGFPYYGNNQQVMGDSIRAAVEAALPTVNITKIIPAGTAIQNGREIFGDVMNIDGYHLSHDLGRYTAACTWCEFITGKSVVGNTYCPTTLTPDQAQKAQQAAHKALTR